MKIIHVNFSGSKGGGRIFLSWRSDASSIFYQPALKGIQGH